MRAVIQRVKEARVLVDENIIGEIDSGILVFLGIGKDDTNEDIEYLLDKIIKLRIFEDKEGKMNLSALDLGKELLIVSQFTLYGDCRKGRRPSFSSAAPPARAESLYDSFLNMAKDTGLKVASGQFQAMMEVELKNDGPVTLLLDSKKDF
ncbi:MAG: D-aminoacyl-tRNA deacylase [Halanaerobiales bacterium]